MGRGTRPEVGSAEIQDSVHQVVYMGRNPKDVLVSYYHFHQIAGFLPNPSSFEDFADEFLEGTGGSQGLRWLSEPPRHPAGGQPCFLVPVASEVSLLLPGPSHMEAVDLLCFLLVQVSLAPGLTM